MAKTKAQKQEILKQYEEYLQNAKAIYIASGDLTANDSNAFKKKLSGDQAKYSIVKNTLFTLAAKNVLSQDLNLSGKNSVVVCLEDVVSPAKSLAELKKESKLNYVMGILEGKIIDASKVEELSKLESREQLLGKLVYLVNYPTTGLARALANNIQKLMYALNAVKDSKPA